ncbi:MAG: hypothetical protein Q7R76_02080 [Candidatus Woesearchaeota archaeon]|nr:hypothetical protein [Candidatus Woesearchaeota archaeon]
MKKAELAWNQIVAMLLALVIIVVVIIIFTGKTAQTSKDVTKCGGLLSFGKYQGECRETCPQNMIQSATFSSDCQQGSVCCVIAGDES